MPSTPVPNGYFRNRALLDAVYLIPCQARLPCCVGGLSQPAHSNWQRHGKGKGIKAHDCYVAAMCPACHRELDQGHTMGREEKQEVWQRAFESTLLLLWQTGALAVNGSPIISAQAM